MVLATAGRIVEEKPMPVKLQIGIVLIETCAKLQFVIKIWDG